MTQPRLSLNSMRMQANGRGEILIYDEIGYGWFEDGVTAKSFMQQLKDLGDVKAIDVRINSPGGSIVHGLAIYNALANHDADIHMHIDGLAASMATVVAMAGDKIHMAANALFMIHEPSGVAIGTAEDMLATAALLETMSKNAVDIYATRTGLAPEAVKAAMTAETWYSAEQAKTAGFVHEITPNKTLVASFDDALMQKAPDWAKARLAVLRASMKVTAKMALKREDLVCMAEAEDSTSGDVVDSEGTVVGSWELTPAEDPPEDPPAADPAEEPAAKVKAKAHAAGAAAERERITTIHSLCQQAKQPGLAAKFCENPNMSVADVRAKLFDALCKNNRPVGDEGGTSADPGKGSDENDKYRQEYKANAGYASQMTEAEYVAMRRIDDGKDQLQVGKNAKK